MTTVPSIWQLAADKVDPPPKVEDPWETLARPEQKPPPGQWLTWVYLAGRGAGKSRSAAEFVKKMAREKPGARIALVARAFADGRDIMVEGESGLLSIIPEHELRGGSVDSAWNRSMGELFMANGSRFKIYSSEKPAALRGPQHNGGWCDEAASWLDAHRGNDDDTTWSNLMLGMRLGQDPRVVVSTTPKPVKLLRGTRNRPGILKQPGTVVTTGSTYDNLTNLAPTFREQVLDRYEGTRLGRQELHAELLDDVEGAMWNRAEMIDAHRIVPEAINGTMGGLVRVVVAIDPAATSTDEADETGIVVAGRGADGRGYVLADRTTKDTPDGWGRRAIAAFHEFSADRIVAEVNNGGEMVNHVLHTVDPNVPVTTVHATRGKQLRAEPIAALYEQGKISHAGMFDILEDEMTSWTPESGTSPDRLDALVWALTALFPPVTAAGQTKVTDERLTRGRRGR